MKKGFLGFLAGIIASGIAGTYMANKREREAREWMMEYYHEKNEKEYYMDLCDIYKERFSKELDKDVEDYIKKMEES